MVKSVISFYLFGPHKVSRWKHDQVYTKHNTKHMHFHKIMFWTYKCKKVESKSLQLLLLNQYWSHWIYNKLYTKFEKHYFNKNKLKICFKLVIWYSNIFLYYLFDILITSTLEIESTSILLFKPKFKKLKKSIFHLLNEINGCK